MHLYHVSEEPDITVFHPRLPKRHDLDPTVGLVWAIDEEHLPNFLTPRDCPRVTYHIRPETTEEDRRRFFTSDNVMHTVIIEHGWFDRMRNTTLYLYEFDPSDFVLQDEIARCTDRAWCGAARHRQPAAHCRRGQNSNPRLVAVPDGECKIRKAR